MHSFSDLVAARREWIEAVLKPWCRTAARADLIAAEQEWLDIAGRADAEKTLWLWAWSRFPVLYVEGLSGIEESYPVTVVLRNGLRHQGFPDARRSRRGQLVLLSVDNGSMRDSGPFGIDEIASMERAPLPTAGTNRRADVQVRT